MPKKKIQKPEQKHLLDRVENPDAAGIDIGAEELVVAVPSDRDPEFVRSFPSFTPDLHDLRDWLLKCGVKTVAIESTGNYWIAVYQILEDAGLKVFLVNARHVKGIGGKKTDVCDAQWLQQLHRAGLLRKSFRPTKEIAPLRYLMRHRAQLVESAARELQLMQKVLNECNLQLHHVFSDLDGQSALRIIEAILAGERDSEVLAQTRDRRCRTSHEKIIKALQGDYREEYLFVLGQCLQRWKQTQEAIGECDAKVAVIVASIEADTEPVPTDALPPRRYHKNSPGFEIFAEARRFYGVDLAAIPGVSSSTLAVLMSELGPGIHIKTAFPSAKHFCSWLGLCPENRISGGKVLTAKTRQSANRVTAALRLCGQALGHAHSQLGDFCRRMKGRLGKAEGITAAAHKLARIIYSLILTRKPYDEALAFALTPQKKARRIRRVLEQAARLGLKLVPESQPA